MYPAAESQEISVSCLNSRDGRDSRYFSVFSVSYDEDNSSSVHMIFITLAETTLSPDMIGDLLGFHFIAAAKPKTESA